MIRRACLVVALTALTPLVCTGTSAFAAADERSVQDEAVEPSVSPPPAGAKRKGDTIHLKGGRTISGMQVIGATPLAYEVAVIEGVVILHIPRGQVMRVEYDDYQPVPYSPPERKTMAPAAQTERPLVPVTSELNTRLRKDIANPPVEYKDQDYAKILTELGRRAQVTVVIGPELLAMPEADRRWSISLPPVTNLWDVLNELQRAFPRVEAATPRDRVEVRLKEPVPEGSAPAPPAASGPDAESSGP